VIKVLLGLCLTLVSTAAHAEWKEIFGVRILPGRTNFMTTPFDTFDRVPAKRFAVSIPHTCQSLTMYRLGFRDGQGTWVRSTYTGESQTSYGLFWYYTPTSTSVAWQVGMDVSSTTDCLLTVFAEPDLENPGPQPKPVIPADNQSCTTAVSLLRTAYATQLEQATVLFGDEGRCFGYLRFRSQAMFDQFVADRTRQGKSSEFHLIEKPTVIHKVPLEHQILGTRGWYSPPGSKGDGVDKTPPQTID
jgi:hypothetical protein